MKKNAELKAIDRDMDGEKNMKGLRSMKRRKKTRRTRSRG